MFMFGNALRDIRLLRDKRFVSQYSSCHQTF